MVRVRSNPAKLRKKRRLLKAAKGYWGARKNLQRLTREAVHHAWQYAFRDRRAKKRNFRALWITRLSAALRAKGITYSRFIDQLTKKKILLNRKVLSELAIHDPNVFEKVVATVTA